MRINNIGEFKTFLIENQLDNIDTATADFVACVLQYSVLCSCKKAQKNQKHDQCNQQYIHTVLHVFSNKKDILFSRLQVDTIDFYYNQSYHIATLSR